MKLCLLLAICLCIAGCESAYPPIVFNGYAIPIEISVSFTTTIAQESKIQLLSNTELVQNRTGLQIKEIVVHESTGKERVYGSAELLNARSKQQTAFEIWILTEQGLRLGDKEDLRRLKGKQLIGQP